MREPRVFLSMGLKGKMANISGFMGHMVFVASAQLFSFRSSNEQQIMGMAVFQ